MGPTWRFASVARFVSLIALITIWVGFAHAESPIEFISLPSSFDDPLTEFLATINCHSQEFDFCRNGLLYNFKMYQQHPASYCSTSSTAQIFFLDDDYQQIGFVPNITLTGANPNPEPPHHWFSSSLSQNLLIRLDSYYISLSHQLTHVPRTILILPIQSQIWRLFK